MKTISPKMKKIIIIIVIVLLCLTVVKDFLLKSVITTTASMVLGTKVEMGYFSLGFFTRGVKIRDFKVWNPSGFTADDPLLDMPAVTVKYDLPALLFKGQVHAPLVAVDVKQMTVVKNKDGVLSTDALKIAQKKEEPQAKTKADVKKEPVKKPAEKQGSKINMLVDVLNLNVGKVVYLDYTKMKADQPNLTIFDVPVDHEQFKNLKSPEEIATVIMMASLKGTAIQSAGLYAAGAVLGVGFMPLAVAGVLTSRDYAEESFPIGTNALYDKALFFLKKNGTVTAENKVGNEIKGKYDDCDIVIKIQLVAKEGNESEIRVSARKMMLPQPNSAEKFIYYMKR